MKDHMTQALIAIFTRRSMHHRALASFFGVLIALSGKGATAMTISLDAPGNLLTDRQPLHARIADAKGEVRYSVVDYFGRTVSSDAAKISNGTATIDAKAFPPGWYELRCEDGDGETVISFGVAKDRGKTPLPADGRVCADAASAWLLAKEEYRKPFARMAKIAGIPWVRERHSWAQIEPEKGRFDWGHYQIVADSFAAEGVHVYSIWHDSPAWTHPNDDKTRCPDDLRDAYRFAKTLSGHFSRQIQAWEVWNEPDISFWPDLSDRFAAFQKAAYLGLKDGNPKALVLQGSLSSGVTPFSKALFASGIEEYFDVFNWHIYADPTAYAGVIRGHEEALKPYRTQNRPFWLTEAGIALRGTEGDGKRSLSAADQRKQCEFIPKSVTLSLAGGDDKHFFFVMPDYLENGIQFGSLHPDLAPYPGFLALSAAARFLGESSYLGQYHASGSGAEVRLFSTPKGSVLVAWSDHDEEIELPTEKSAVNVADSFGAEREVTAKDGAIRIQVGPAAVYVLDAGDRLKPLSQEMTKPKGTLPKNHPSRIVLAGYSTLPIDKSANCYRLEGGESDTSFDYIADVYNFDEKKSAEGTAKLTGPEGWEIDEPERSVRLEPMGRERLLFKVTPKSLALDPMRLTLTAKIGGHEIPPTASDFQANPASMRPAKTLALDWADAAKWTPNVSANGTMTATNPEPGVLRVTVHFNGNGDRWAYPYLAFDPPQDFTGYDGIAFNLKTDRQDADAFAGMQLAEPNGSSYLAMTPFAGEKRRVVLLFREMRWGPFSPPDPDGKLSLNQIGKLLFGCNPMKDDAVLEASDFELIRFSAPKG